ncbi:hypothetical protein CFP65_3968 [Kitasatospora sp. MMS16-BH015]|uniref:hypothetical protein n=1 Tax=Kitasatospora sp. MMS16-BH015 TaxID=2018025 RepID=UPI000CA2C0E2|nr:hypothetical protein [Kitasatospora sp. MMS16-BH015]AUG78738.1 hypothetical protein CFP65_3968 [Kitasatospora sp. MMS16-BH015]
MAEQQDVVGQLLREAAEEAGPLELGVEQLTGSVRRRRLARAGAAGLAIGCLAAGAVLTVQALRPSEVAVAAKPPVVTARPTPGPSGEVNCTGKSTDPLMKGWESCQYIGLTLEQGRAQAATEHRDFVIVWRDGVSYPITMELRPTRVTVKVEHDRITQALIG